MIVKGVFDAARMLAVDIQKGGLPTKVQGAPIEVGLKGFSGDKVPVGWPTLRVDQPSSENVTVKIAMFAPAGRTDSAQGIGPVAKLLEAPPNVEIPSIAALHRVTEHEDRNAALPKFNRNLVQTFLQSHPLVEKIVANSGNRIVELPNRVERVILGRYQEEMKVSPALDLLFAPNINLIKDVGLLQSQDALKAVKSLEVPHYISERLTAAYEHVTWDVREQNDLLARLFVSDVSGKPPRSNVSVGESAKTDYLGELTQNARYVTGLLINLAQNIPASDAALQRLANNGKINIRFDIDDAASVKGKAADAGEQPRPFYQLEWQDGGLRVVFDKNMFTNPQTSYLHSVDVPDVKTETDQGGAGLKYDLEQHQIDMRRIGVSALRVAAHAVHEADRAVQEKLGAHQNGSLSSKDVESIFNQLKEQPLAYVVPSLFVSEPLNEAGEFRDSLTNAMRLAEQLDNMIELAHREDKPRLQNEIYKTIPELMQSADFAQRQAIVDAALAASELGEIRFDEGWIFDDFLLFLNSLRYQMNDIEMKARQLSR